MGELKICPNCGGIRGCTVLGCTQHQHCDCGEMQVVTTKW